MGAIYSYYQQTSLSFQSNSLVDGGMPDQPGSMVGAIRRPEKNRRRTIFFCVMYENLTTNDNDMSSTDGRSQKLQCRVHVLPWSHMGFQGKAIFFFSVLGRFFSQNQCERELKKKTVKKNL